MNIQQYTNGVVAAKRDLAHIIKIFQEGASKLTLTTKNYVCIIKNSGHCISMMDSLISSA